MASNWPTGKLNVNHSQFEYSATNNVLDFNQEISRRYLIA